MRRSGILVALIVAACGAPPPAPEATAAAPIAAPVPEGSIVARVDGEPIALAEVEATARATGLSPLDALHRLEQERALDHRASRAALASDGEAEDAMRRASVQALLRARVEDAVPPSSVSDDEIAARYEATRASWARPERRASLNVLAAPRTAGDEAALAAARRFVEQAIPRLVAAADPAAEAHALETEVGDDRSFTLRVEDVPAAPRHGALEEPYAAALFAIATTPGVAPEPVTTHFGVHAIVLTGIHPPFEISLAEATPILRRQLVAEHRGAALDALTNELASRTTVAVDERLVAAVVARDLSSDAVP
jgi:hypothetical protein